LLRMTSKELRAAIPTHETWASKSKGWEMPNKRLWTELRQRCVSPVLRADRGDLSDVSTEFSL
jgi:hypothetical protein